MVAYWDIDRYHELQDAAWARDVSAAEQDKAAKLDANVPNGDETRSEARALRVEAAQMLGQYWVFPRHDRGDTPRNQRLMGGAISALPARRWMR